MQIASDTKTCHQQRSTALGDPHHNVSELWTLLSPLMTPAVGKYLPTVHTIRGASFLFSTTEADIISETTLFHHTTQTETDKYLQKVNY